MFAAHLTRVFKTSWSLNGCASDSCFDFRRRAVQNSPRGAAEGVRSPTLKPPLTGTMSGARKYVNMGLVLLMCMLTGHCGESAPSAAPAAAAGGSKEAQMDWRRVVEMVKHVEDSRSRHSSRTDAPATSRTRNSTAEPRDLRSLRTEKAEKNVGEWRRVIWV